MGFKIKLLSTELLITHLYYSHSKPSSLQKPLALVQIVFPVLIIPLDLEYPVGIHAEAVILPPGLQHCLAPSLVFWECFVAADLAGPGMK